MATGRCIISSVSGNKKDALTSLIHTVDTVFRSVFFDMDGVVLDSSVLWNHVTAMMQSCFGLDTSLADVPGSRDLTTEEAVTLILGKMGIFSTELSEKILNDVDCIYSDCLDSMTSIYPGIPDVLAMLKGRGVPAILVSNSSRRQVDMVMEHYGLRGYFAGTVSSDDVHRGKPDPEPYLRALSLAGVSGHYALAVEDTMTGAAAAARAGISCVLVTDDCSVLSGDAENSGLAADFRTGRDGLYVFLDKVTDR